MILAGIYNYLPLLPILYFLCALQVPQQVLALFLEETHAFNSDGAVSCDILPGLGCCRFPLALITEHHSIKRCPKEFPTLKHNLSYCRISLDKLNRGLSLSSLL